MGGVDRERHEDGEDLLRERLIDLDAVGLVEVRPVLDVDARIVELGLHEAVEAEGVPVLELESRPIDVGEDIRRRPPDVGRHGEARDDAPLEARDPHHEELVEVRGEDREEVDALEERHGGVLRELENALVEAQPAHLAVEVALDGQSAVIDARGLVPVVEEVAADAPIDLVARIGAVLLVLHAHIMPGRRVAAVSR